MLSIIQNTNENTLASIKEEMAVRKTNEFFILFGFGSQTDGLIFMMLAKIGIFCVLANPKTMTWQDVLRLKDIGLIGIIGSGGPYSVHCLTEPVPFDTNIFSLRIPMLGICLSFQMIAQFAEAVVVPARLSECTPEGIVTVKGSVASPLFDGIPMTFKAGFSHGDEVRATPHCNFMVTAESENGLVASGEYKYLHGVQFHPEVSHTEHGQKIFENFCFKICGAKDRIATNSAVVVPEKVTALRDLIGDDTVAIALSGGVDSSVALKLLLLAVSRNRGHVHAIYIKGLDRYLDERHVRTYFVNQPWFTVHFIDATREFLDALKGIEDGGKKRLAMVGVYVAVLERIIKETGAKWLVSGTNYADISESHHSLADVATNTIQLVTQVGDDEIRKDVIKRHHNVGNKHSVPEVLPVVDHVKDMIRDLGRELGMPEELLMKQPFPGPGLSVRVDGEVTTEKIDIARELDRIWDEELKKLGADKEIWQYGVDLLRSEVTTSRGDTRGKGYRVALWAKTSVNGFTAEPYLFKPEFLRKVAVRMTSEVPQVGCVMYDFTPKPPKTIEQS